MRATTPAEVPLAWSWSGDDFAYEMWMDGEYLEEVAGDWRYAGMLMRVRGTPLQPSSTHTFTVRNRDEGGNLSAPARRSRSRSGEQRHDATGCAERPKGRHRPGLRVRDFMWSGAGDVEMFEDAYFIGVWSDEVIMTSFGRHTYTIRAVDAPGTQPGQQRRRPGSRHGC